MYLILILPAVVSALEGKDCREVMKSIADSSVVPQEKLSHIVAGMYRVLSEAIRIPTSLLKQEVSWLDVICPESANSPELILTTRQFCLMSVRQSRCDELLYNSVNYIISFRGSISGVLVVFMLFRCKGTSNSIRHALIVNSALKSTKLHQRGHFHCLVLVKLVRL